MSEGKRSLLLLSGGDERAVPQAPRQLISSGQSTNNTDTMCGRLNDDGTGSGNVCRSEDRNNIDTDTCVVVGEGSRGGSPPTAASSVADGECSTSNALSSCGSSTTEEQEIAATRRTISSSDNNTHVTAFVSHSLNAHAPPPLCREAEAEKKSTKASEGSSSDNSCLNRHESSSLLTLHPSSCTTMTTCTTTFLTSTCAGSSGATAIRRLPVRPVDDDECVSHPTAGREVCPRDGSSSTLNRHYVGDDVRPCSSIRPNVIVRGLLVGDEEWGENHWESIQLGGALPGGVGGLILSRRCLVPPRPSPHHQGERGVVDESPSHRSGDEFVCSDSSVSMSASSVVVRVGDPVWIIAAKKNS